MRKLITVLFCLGISLFLSGQNTEKWSFDLNDMSFGNSASADIDNDGYLEIVFSTYRNDSSVYAINAEDGSLLWKVNTGGCNDVAPLIYDVDMDGDLEVILPSSCVAKTFCFDGRNGDLEWYTNTRGSDSPPTVADLDGDGKPEILHGEFGGYVICINGEDGSVKWELSVNTNSWVQTAPAILDVDDNGQLDFVVATWVFGGEGDIYAYTGDSAQLIWQDTIPNDYFYHGASFADIDEDGKPELVIGCYNGYVYCLNAEDGSHAWSYLHPDAYPQYVGAPTSLADLNNDGHLEIVFDCGNRIGVLSNTGDLLWDYTIPAYGSAFRGAAISDINNDDTLDVVFGTSGGELIGLSGAGGELLFYEDIETLYGNDFEIDHGPVIGDFDNDSINDIFIVGGHAEYPDIFNNYGRAYAFETPGGKGQGWPMFRFDERRSGCFKDTTSVNSVDLIPGPHNDISIIQNGREINVYCNLPDSYKVRLIDMTGKEVGSYYFEGRYLKILPPQSLSGIYLVNVTGKKVINTQKIFIKV